MDLGGIDETLRFIPDRLFFFCTDITDLHDTGRFIDTVAVLEDGHKELPHGITSAGELRFFPGLQRIEDRHVPGGVKGLVIQADQIRTDLARVVVIDPVDRLAARVRDLFRVFGDLDLRNKASFFILDRSHFVDAAEAGVVLARDQIGADAPGGDGGALDLQGFDQVLVQVVGGGDHGVFKACRIQHLADFLGKVSKVAAVETDAVALHLDALVLHVLEGPDGIGNAGL